MAIEMAYSALYSVPKMGVSSPSTSRAVHKPSWATVMSVAPPLRYTGVHDRPHMSTMAASGRDIVTTSGPKQRYSLITYTLIQYFGSLAESGRYCLIDYL